MAPKPLSGRSEPTFVAFSDKPDFVPAVMLRFGKPCIKDGADFSQPSRGHDRLPPGSSMSDFSTARQKMVDGQVRPSDVTDNRIIDAMLAIPREAFVPEAQRSLAYLDLDIDVSAGGPVKRFLLRPAATAKMVQAAEISETDDVL